MSNAPALVTTQAPVRQTRVHLLDLGRTHPRVMLAAGLVALLFLVALLAPFLSPHDPIAVNADNAYLRPLSPGHLLGTDELGRDLFSRILWGARVSLPVAFVAVAVGLVAGGLIGTLAGGWIADRRAVKNPAAHLEVGIAGFLLGATKRITVMPLLVVPCEPPVSMAKAIATLDWISGGRTVPVLMTGYLEWEFEFLGVPFAERGAMMELDGQIVQMK